MDVDEHFELEHLYLTERVCKVCGQRKDLIDGFYLSRRNRYQPSSYSYECKECAIKRISSNRKNKNKRVQWEYPDW